MAFVAPTGYAASAMGHSPRSGSNATFSPVSTSTSLSNPASLANSQSSPDGIKMDENAIAGPSGSGPGLDYNGFGMNYDDESSRRTSKEDMPVSPSSAPPNPSVISVTHPPEFIHTHHPRRGSLTPLGLNVISPIGPLSMAYGTNQPPHSPVRSIGFIPNPAQSAPNQPFPDAFPSQAGRRGSGASSSSTLTLSRPSQLGSSASGSQARDRRRSSLVPYPAGFTPESRRASLAQPSPPSPTRAHATGVFGRPSSSDGRHRRTGSSDNSKGPPPLHVRHHTTHGPGSVRPTSQAIQQALGDARRGSMPQLHYGGWNGPRWNPSLAPPRGSVGDEPLPDDEFKFGSASEQTPTPASAATFALRAIDISPARRELSNMDAFQEQEVEEADRQQRAFLAATYGADGRRARDRLSIGGPVANTPASPSMRRPSLMLWEKLGMAAAAKQFAPELAASSAPTLVLPTRMSEDELGHRRGSLPIAIPIAGRSPSSHRSHDLDEDQTLDEEGQSDEGVAGGYGDRLAPVRPAPPLLPLSDPGPRLLPSTLALQRASHLLSSRNLQADPLPHPLPPSLHPPIPVDVTEFDIDFILAGSRAQLGGRRSNATANANVDAIAPFAAPGPATTLRLGADEEDSFAKFVGKFDDEYGGRRGEWTFRAKGPPIVDAGDGPRAVWESPGAGSYDLFANGDVRSEKNSTIWRTFRKGVCEYELEAVTASLNTYDAPSPLLLSNDRFVLATKAAHGEAGGIKFPSGTTPHVPSGRTSLEPPRAFANRLRVSISEATRAMRLDSTDSNATAKLSSSLPTGPTMKKKRRPSKDDESDKDKGRTEQHSQSFSSAASNRLMRVKSKDKEREKDKENKEKDKEDSNKKAGFFKRGIIAPFKNSIAQYEEKRAQKEERDRERQQAHSWGGSTNTPGWIHPSGKNTPSPLPSPTSSGPRLGGATERSSSARASSTIPPSVRTSTSEDQGATFAPWLGSESRRGSSSNIGSGGAGNWKEGKAWAEVPEDAVAMVVPCNAGDTSDPNGDAASVSIDTRQALLVWYVPFNSDTDERERERERSTSTTPRPGLGSSSGASASASSAEASANSPSVATSSLPKLQKLLRRRTSKDKDLVRNPSQRSTEQDQPFPRAPRRPLPFRSFRVVARLVDLDDLRSEDLAHASGTSLFPDHPKTSLSPPLSNFVPPPRAAAASVDSALQPKPRLVTLQTNTTTSSSLSGSTAPTSTILAGRTISTVVAVCHSRSQGVEFVLEGLDRLGYCVGESAWGPTGYEEWRGTGLSEKGRELLDLLWAGCTAVMGLV